MVVDMASKGFSFGVNELFLGLCTGGRAHNL